MIERLETPDAPPPGGHYSQGIAFRDLIFVSGQLPVTLDGRQEQRTFDEQARVALANMLAIVQAGGGDAASVLKVTAYIVGIENWPRFNAVFAELFGDARPARAVVPVPELHYGYLVEVEAVAARRG